MKLIVILLVSSVIIAGCSGGGGGGGGGGGSASNKFTASSAPLTVDDMVSPAKSAAGILTSTTYYGRVLYTSGGHLFGASIHFTLNKNNGTTAYFTNFYLDRLVQVTAYNSATAIVTTSTNLNVPGSYNSGTNGVSIGSATSRFVNFNLDFGDNTNFADISNAGVIFSSDFSTMVGGNNLSFFFIAQKASSLPAVSSSDIQSSWSLANFTVNGSGSIVLASTSTVSVAGTGGHGLLAFTGSSGGSSFAGETSLTDSGTGVFIFGFDSTPVGTPSADGTLDGAFLLSPDKKFILGYDDVNAQYFAASK